MEIHNEEVSPQQISVGILEKEITDAYVAADEKQLRKHLFDKDATLWVKDPAQIKEIKERLGWLSLADHFTENVENLISFSLKIKEEGYTDTVLLGMGGSSLCSEVAKETFGTTKSYLQLHVLDNTAPEAILELENKIALDKTLFIVASKSGNTKETLSFFRYFYSRLEKKKIVDPGNHFVAITDDGTPLIQIAKEYKFRKVFVNPADLGGRYSVLSDFGLVPMALMGIDIKAFLSNARQMKNICEITPVAVNPGISLGVVLGICQQHGRDKVTFVLSSSISSFGYWVEQLLAESTGKEGRGLIPVNGELPGSPEVYGSDRIFIHMYLADDNNAKDVEKIKALEEAGHPIVRIKLANKIALGGEYYRWEIATAVAGIVLGINAFDQPNVEESKKNTNLLLEEWTKEGTFKQLSPPGIQSENMTIYNGTNSEKLTAHNFKTVGDFVNGFTAQSKPADYIALLPYFMMTEHRTKILTTWREQLKSKLKTATTLLNGPRYLHSTGQLHKGGPDSGLYIILIGDEEKELAIPGEKFSFSVLHMAQALGDFRSLDDKGRRVIRIHLGKKIDEGLDKLYQSINDSSKHKIS